MHSAQTKAQNVANQREEILQAFVAKFGFQPDECMQIEQRGKWYVIHLDPETVRATRLAIIERRFYQQGPTLWQRLCLWMARLK